MQLILYPFIVFIIVFLLQIFFIMKKEKNRQIDARISKSIINFKFIIKIIVALILSAIMGIISFYLFGLLVLVGLNEGR